MAIRVAKNPPIIASNQNLHKWNEKCLSDNNLFIEKTIVWFLDVSRV